MPLHISKVAFGCASIETFARRQALREKDGIVPLVTRFRPTRADELIGGSVFWIVKHRMLARQAILGFALRESDRRTIISLDAQLVPVRATARRAHQGWRYLEEKKAPPDLAEGELASDAMPGRLIRKLSALGLA